MPKSFHTLFNDTAAKLRTEAEANGHTRLLAYACYGDANPERVTWQSFPDDPAMEAFIASWETSDDPALTCAMAIAVVIPQDSLETIHFQLSTRSKRAPNAPGYFPSAVNF